MTPEPIQRVAVIGTTSWGTTLAVHLARNGLDVRLGARSDTEAQQLNDAREHTTRLPGIEFPETLYVQPAAEAAVDAELVCFVVPSRTLVDNARAVASTIPSDAILLSATKGIESGTGRRMSELLAAELPNHPIAVLSGPNLAKEVVRDLPSTTVIASNDAPLERLRGRVPRSCAARLHQHGHHRGRTRRSPQERCRHRRRNGRPLPVRRQRQGCRADAWPRRDHPPRP